MIPSVARHFRASTLCLLGGLLLGPLPGKVGLQAAPPPKTSNYFFETWPMAEGMELNTVTAIVQSRCGYLWLGTYDGLVRFDGVRFKVFDAGNTPGLLNSRVTALFEDGSGLLWIGHETGGLTQLRDGEFTRFRPVFPWPGGPIQAIAADPGGDVWLASDHGGLFRLRDGHCSLLHEAKIGWPGWLASGKRGRLWVVSNGTMGTIEEGIFTPFQSGETNAIPYNYEQVVPAQDGSLWVLRDGQIGKWRDGQWEIPMREVPWTNDHASTLLETRAGALLVGTQRNGLYLLLAGTAPLHFTRIEGLPSDQVRCLAQDHEGNIWIGTSQGLCAMRGRKVEMLDAPNGWSGHKILSFITRPDGSAWVGTQGPGLYHYERGQWTYLDETSGLPNASVWSVIQTRGGELLVGTWGGGLLVEKSGRFKAYGNFNKTIAPVLAMYEGRQGELWIGTGVGLYRYESGQPVWFAGKEKLAVPDVRAITESSDATLWFGLSGGGLGRLQAGVLDQFRKADGLTSDFVHCLYGDADGSLWIGTPDHGLGRWRNGKFSSIGREQGLPGNAISQIVDDGTGHLWFGSQRGILRASKTELNDCADDKTRTVRFLSYGKSDGLTSPSCPGGFQPGAAKAADGRLWFPTTKGIAIVDPTSVSTNQTPPRVVIEEFMVDGNPLEQWNSGALPDASAYARVTILPGTHRFELRYTGLSFVAPDRVRFKHRLEGLELEWSEAGAERSVQYSYLRPGPYRFYVTACNNDDVWNETGAAVAFVVLPHVWQTWWFQLATLGCGAGLVVAGVLAVNRRRVRRKLAQLERQRLLEKERARIARDIHDDLGASLTRITMLSQTMRHEFANDSAGARAATQVNTTARELTRAMDEIVWAVSPKHDTLDSLATYLGGFAQDLLEAAQIRCRLNIPLHLPAMTLTAETRHNVFLAFKEALNNVLKHSGATEVTISLQVEPPGLVLTIADNGRGFELNAATGPFPAAAKSNRNGGGNGLPNLQKRLEEIGSRCEWHSVPGGGTTVRFVIPVNP